MSDGPHRSLPMPLAWKTLAERADVAGFSATDVRDAVCPALGADWRNEAPDSLLPRLRAALGIGSTGMLFSDQTERDLAALRSRATSPLAGLVIDYARQAIADGLQGEAVLTFAVPAALHDRALCAVRQVDEHYHRKVGQERTDNVRSRLEAAIGAAPIDRLARDLLGGQPRPGGRARVKRDGLDDGVAL
jgi:hypothetical protein